MLALIEPHYPRGEGGRPAYPLESMLRVHLMQNWFGYSDPAMEEALYETTLLRQFAGLNLDRVPDESTILNFRRLLERHGTIVDATIIHAQSSTKNQDGKRAPEMRQTRKGNQYYVGMKAHIGSRCLSTMYRHPGILDFSRTLVPFQPEDLGGCTVTPVPLQHSRLTFGYVFQRGGKRCAYLTDTVGLPADTAAWLRREPLDLLVLDCSFPPTETAPRNHNDLTLALETVQSLPVRRTVLTHIGHELDAWLMENENALPDGVEAGHDGRVVEV